MAYSVEEFKRVFSMASNLRWASHSHRCTWLTNMALDPNCRLCAAKMDWDNYINSLKAQAHQ